MNDLIKDTMLITRETWAGIVVWILVVGGAARAEVRRSGWTRGTVVPLAFLVVFGLFVAAAVNPIFLGARAASGRQRSR